MGRDRIKVTEQQASQALEQGQEQAQQETATFSPDLNPRQAAVLNMQRTAGNDAVRRAMAQRKGAYGMEGGPIDDQTASQINSARSGGQPLDSNVAQRMGEQMGADFSGVKVHADEKSDQLNQTLSAQAFTTGKDIFFQQGAYNPSSSSGQQLLAHELTHVVQQGGSYDGGSMTLGPAGDSYEAEAEKTSASLGSAAPTTQRHMDGDENDVQTMRVQRESMPEEEEPVQASRIQRESMPEEEEPVQASRIQREESDEMEEEQM
jgi:hypothetical protein